MGFKYSFRDRGNQNKSSSHFPSTAEDLGSQHVLLQLLHQPAGLCVHRQQLQEGLQTHLPHHVSVVQKGESRVGNMDISEEEELNLQAPRKEEGIHFLSSES